MGSILVALRAGIILAANATRASKPAIPAKVNGSVALVLNSKFLNNWVRKKAANAPIPNPIAVRTIPRPAIVVDPDKQPTSKQAKAAQELIEVINAYFK